MNEAEEALLSFSDFKVTISNTQHEVLDIPTFEINKGTCVGIRGKSGEGKTTFLHSLLGILNPETFITSGNLVACFDQKCVKLDGLSSEERIGYNRKLFAFIPQEPDVALNPIMRIGKQISSLSPGHKNKKAIEDELESMLSDLSLQDTDRILKSYPHQLSGGQLQRCIIAGALIKNAEVLLADEPVSSLDALTAAEIVQIFNWIRHETSKTIIIVSHNDQFLEKVCDRIYTLEKGKLLTTNDSKKSQSVFQNRNISNHPQNEQPIISVQDLSAYYAAKERVDVLDGISFDLSQGEKLGIVGASGSGKSTLGKILVGLHHSFSGHIQILRQSNQNISRRERASIIQLIFQDSYSSLNPKMSISTAMNEVFRIHQPGFNTEDVDEILRAVQIDPALKFRFPHQLSGGQRQRIVIARALAVKPKVLICDEIVSNLDPETAQNVLDLLNRIHLDQEISLIFISHNLHAVRQICDQVIVLKDGKIVEQGRIDEVCDQPKHAYTKRLLEAAY